MTPRFTAPPHCSSMTISNPRRTTWSGCSDSPPGPVQRDDHGNAVHTEVVLGTSASGCIPSAGLSVPARARRSHRDDSPHGGRGRRPTCPKSVAAGAEIIESPVDQGYGAREHGARDPEGQLWFFHAPLDRDDLVVLDRAAVSQNGRLAAHAVRLNIEPVNSGRPVASRWRTPRCSGSRLSCGPPWSPTS